MGYSFTHEIRKKYNELRNSEKKVADVLLSPDFDIVNASIEELAHRAEVSQPTIIRFANAVGCKGFKEVKNRMTKEIIQHESKTELAKVVTFQISPQDKLVDIPLKVVNTHMQHMEGLLKNLSSYELIKAIDHIVKADKIVVFAVENSACVADDLTTKLTYMGFDVLYHKDPYLHKVCAKSIGKNDVAIGISHTGYSKITVDSLAIAKSMGATTISITNSQKTLINKYADIILAIENEQFLYGQAIFSRCTQIALIDMIYTGILLTDYEKYSENIEMNTREIEEFGYKENA